jgi:hypothetical protein
MFWGTLKRFNFNEPISIEFKRIVEKHFEYRWENNLLSAIQVEDTGNVYKQLPSDVQHKIFRSYLYGDFLRSYRRIFQF